MARCVVLFFCNASSEKHICFSQMNECLHWVPYCLFSTYSTGISEICYEDNCHTMLANGNIFQSLPLNTWHLAYLNVLKGVFILYWSAAFRVHLILEVFCDMSYKFIRIKSCLRPHNPYWECRKEVGEEVIMEWWFDLLNLGNKVILWEQNASLVFLPSSFKVVSNFLLLKWPILPSCNIEIFVYKAPKISSKILLHFFPRKKLWKEWKLPFQ